MKRFFNLALVATVAIMMASCMSINLGEKGGKDTTPTQVPQINQTVSMSAFDEVVKTFQEFAEPKDQKAKDAISLYATMLSLGKRYGAQPETIVNNAGYVLYAYLGGQARREITQADFLKGNNTK